MNEMTYPQVLNDIGEAVSLLQTYVFDREDDLPRFTGARFEAFHRDDNDRDVLTAADLLAVSMLGVAVPGLAVLRILEVDAENITRMLSGIRADLTLVNADDSDIGRGSNAFQLWQCIDKYHGVGHTITSKIMARKRPHLIPIQDSVMTRALMYQWGGDGNDFWFQLRSLIGKRPNFSNDMATIRDRAGVGDQFSDLRTFDIVVWMAHRRGASR